MAFFDKLGDLAKNLGEKTTDAIETTKLQSKVNSEKNAAGECLRRIGEYYYAKHAAGETLDPALTEDLLAADGHYAAAAEAEAQIQAIRAPAAAPAPEPAPDPFAAPAGAVCPACGAENAPGTRFCGGCGARLETVRHCPNCGEAVQPGVRFCSGCGSKVD